MRTARSILVLLAVWLPVATLAQVSYQRLKNASSEPANWLMYGGATVPSAFLD
jgi:hypothetical protein